MAEDKGGKQEDEDDVAAAAVAKAAGTIVTAASEPVNFQKPSRDEDETEDNDDEDGDVDEKGEPVVPDLKGAPPWLNAIIRTIPRLRKRIQVTGLVVGTAAGVVGGVVVPGDPVAIILGGSLGVSFIIFGQAFAYLRLIPKMQRAFYILALVFMFLLFEGVLAFKYNSAVAEENTAMLTRDADFSALTCVDGKKHDVAILKDIYELDRKPKVFRLGAETMKGQSVVLSRTLSSGVPILLPPAETGSELDGARKYTWTINPDGRRVAVQFDWTNANSDSESGLYFVNEHKIRGISATAKFPSGVELSGIHWEPASAAAVCSSDPPAVPGDPYRFACPAMDTNGPITVLWKWNVWEKCPA
jgi:hypothetical protein